MATILGVPTQSPNLTKELQKSGIVWKLSRSFSRTYLVLADSLEETQESILATVPGLGTMVQGCMCKNVEVSEVDAVHNPATGELTSLNKIVCSFDSDVRLDPLDLDAEVRWGAEQEEEAMWKDVNGVAIQTKVGEEIPMTRPVVIPVLEIRRYENFPFDPNTILEYTNTINSGVFWGAPAKHALLASIECDYVDVELYDGVKKKFAQVSYRIKFKKSPDPDNDEPWKVRPLHYGNYCWEEGASMSDSNRKKKRITDKSGRPIQGNLDINGFLLGADAEPVFLAFDKYPEKNFNSLGINRSQLGY